MVLRWVEIIVSHHRIGGAIAHTSEVWRAHHPLSAASLSCRLGLPPGRLALWPRRHLGTRFLSRSSAICWLGDCSAVSRIAWSSSFFHTWSTLSRKSCRPARSWVFNRMARLLRRFNWRQRLRRSSPPGAAAGASHAVRWRRGFRRVRGCPSRGSVWCAQRQHIGGPFLGERLRCLQRREDHLSGQVVPNIVGSREPLHARPAMYGPRTGTWPGSQLPKRSSLWSKHPCPGYVLNR